MICLMMRNHCQILNRADGYYTNIYLAKEFMMAAQKAELILFQGIKKS